MAVEAHYHRLFSPQLYKNNTTMDNLYGSGDIQAGGLAGAGQICTAPLPTTDTSGVLIGVNDNNKRPFSFLGQDVSSQIKAQMLDIDRLVLQHVMNARTELSIKRKRFSNQIMATLNESVSRQLKVKDEEILQLKRLNWAMEERIKSLGIENNAWKYMAQTHEAAAASLKLNLEQVLADHSNSVAADDAESCCGDNFILSSTAAGEGEERRRCRNCGNKDASVLLLPCRHLCLCSSCAPAIEACPICKCIRTVTVNVNLC